MRRSGNLRQMPSAVVSFLSVCPQKLNTLIVTKLKNGMLDCCVACNIFYAVEMRLSENRTLVE